MFCGPAEQVPIPRDCLRTLRAALARPDGATILVVGPTGCCKSTAVLCALRDMGDAPLVIDAATERAGAVDDALRRAPQTLPVVIESAETAAAAISAAVRDAPPRRKPTVLVALACRALAPLRAVATVSIAFRPVPQHNVAIVLARQGAETDAECIQHIARQSAGDLRAALTALRWAALAPAPAVALAPDRPVAAGAAAAARLLRPDTALAHADDLLADELCAATLASMRHRHLAAALGMAVALSDRDAGRGANEANVAFALAARHHSAGRAPSAAFPGAAAFGTAPRKTAARRGLRLRDDTLHFFVEPVASCGSPGMPLARIGRPGASIVKAARGKLGRGSPASWRAALAHCGVDG